MCSTSCREPELALHEGGTAGGADDPAGRGLLLVALGAERDAVVGVARAELDVLDGAAVAQVDADRAAAVGELVLEHAAVDLVRLDAERDLAPRRRRAPLDAARDVAVVAGREVVAEAELPQVRVVEVVAQPADVREVVARDLERRLADLERCLGRRPLPLLQHEHGGLRARALELQGQRQPGEPAAQDRDIVSVPHVCRRLRVSR